MDVDLKVKLAAILTRHVNAQAQVESAELIPSGTHEVYKVLASNSTSYVVKLGTDRWPQKIESDVATAEYLRQYTNIPVPTILGFQTGDWRSDYILMEFVEGEKLAFIRHDLSLEEKRAYAKQVAGFYKQLDNTALNAIGSLRLGGVVGPLDTMDTTTRPDGSVVGVTLGPYPTFQAYTKGLFDYTIDKLENDPLLRANADLVPLLRTWVDKCVNKVPVRTGGPFRLFSLECMKPEDIIVHDGRIVAVLDFENYQTNIPEFLKHYEPFRTVDMKIFEEECRRLEVSAWKDDPETKKRYQYCLDNMLIMQQIVPGDYDSFIRNDDQEGLKQRLVEAREYLTRLLEGSDS
ncbi:hypothetical protein FRB90_012169 [Tulasnella sp. 427]|nr:hypothetical protein FRB90_012169 [Tulasnella sp. 427]